MLWIALMFLAGFATDIAAEATNQTAQPSLHRQGQKASKGDKPAVVFKISEPVERLFVEPSQLHFSSAGESASVRLTAVGRSGAEYDVTTDARWSGPGTESMAAKGVLTGVKAGTATVTARFRGVSALLPVDVQPSGVADGPVSFVQDVLPVLSKAGCNAGACHAKPEGQNGFKLSVFSYDPKSDYFEIVKEGRGRRVFPAAPAQSLLLLKSTLAMPHEGGQRIIPASPAYQLVVRWIQEGMAFQRTNEPTLQSIEVYPKERRYRHAQTQRLMVKAHYSDKSVRDVTHLAVFDASDKEIAKVTEQGVVTAGELTGEAVVVARFMGLVDASRVTVPAVKVLPDSLYAQLPVNNFVDRLAYDQFRKLGLKPSELCSDAEFLRRSTLDTIGLLPKPEEAREFLADTRPDKRVRWIDRLLKHPAYADYWANKWADLLRPNPDRVGVKSVYVLDQWLRESFASNKAYDQFAREVILAQGTNHKDGPAVVYRDRREPADLTTMFSQVFLGLRFECAKCHHHPNEKWAQEDFYQLAAFFGPVRQKGAGLSPPISAGTETFYFAPGGEVRHPVSGAVMKPKAPDGPWLATDAASSGLDPRETLAKWMVDPNNPFFAKAMANRVWAVFFGRGIVDPVDDFRVSNPSSNDALLAALGKDFADHGYDLKHLMRRILESRVYQLGTAPNETNLADTKNFSRGYRRRLPAEVLLDAVCDVTGTTETFIGMPPGTRAIQNWTYKIDSQFLDAFSRPNASSDCPCERDRNTSVVQSLHMMNSRSLQSKLADTKGIVHQLSSSDRKPAEIVTELYLRAYSRLPTERELGIAVRTFEVPGVKRQTATEDLLWALLNAPEFVFNH